MKKVLFLIMLVLSCSLAYALTDEGLFYWLAMEDNAGNNYVVDASGNTSFLSSSATNSRTTTGIVNNGLDFDDANSEYIYNTTNSHEAYSQGTYNIWMNADDTADGDEMIFNYGGDADRMQLEERDAPETYQIYIKDGGTQKLDHVETGYSIDVGNWHMFTLRQNATRLSFWVDAVEIKNYSNTYWWDDMGGGGTNNYFGSWYGGGSNFYNGQMDELSVWVRPLTKSEIEELYNSGSGITYSDLEGGEPPAEGSGLQLNISIDAPLNGTYWGYAQMTGNNSMIWINLTHNATGNYSVTVNDTRFSLYSNTSNKRYYLNNTLLENGFYHVNATITQETAGLNASDFVIFYVDVTNPNIIPTSALENNGTFIMNDTLVTSIQFTDDQEVWSINITNCSNDAVIYNKTNVGKSSYTVNLSYAVDDTPLGCIDVRLCDAHTNNKIKDLVTKKENYGIKYVMKQEFLIFDTEWVRIYPKNPTLQEDATTTKEDDRYIFTMPRATVYVVESSHYIDVPKRQLFGGHLVIPGIGGGYWVDFTNENANNYNINRVSDTKVEVVITGLTGDFVTFSSIGELNCVQKTYYWNNLNPALTYNQNTTPGTTENFYLDLTIAPNFWDTPYAFFHYNNTYNGQDTSLNFSGSAQAPPVHGLFQDVYWWFYFSPGEPWEINTTKTAQRVHNLFVDNCTNSSFYNALDGYFKNIDDATPTNVNATIDITGDATYSGEMINITEFNLCVYPNFVNLSLNVDIDFTKNGNTQSYNQNFNLSNISLTTLNLYVQEGDSETTFTIKDKDTQELLNNVYVTMYRKISGNWSVVESLYSDITGRVRFDYVQDIEYQFLLTKTNYETYIFYLNPILFSEYDVYMIKDVTLNQSMDYDKVALYYYPQIFYNNNTNNFTFMIHSPYNELLEYGYTLTYPGGSSSNSGTSANGEQFTSIFTITGAENTDRLRLDYYYRTDIAGYRNFTYYYSIVVGNYTLMHNLNTTYGLGLFERVLVSVFIVLLVVGVASLVGQPLAGGALGLLLFGFLSFIGFIPLWAILLPVLLGIIYLGSER